MTKKPAPKMVKKSNPNMVPKKRVPKYKLVPKPSVPYRKSPFIA